ncbi:hypothetical protein C8Q79DRAFT_1059552 [Trametes meyenii]|nr:hypothetical protein C8Q79DRAFT_1059552 [Trametes meyenii]
MALKLPEKKLGLSMHSTETQNGGDKGDESDTHEFGATAIRLSWKPTLDGPDLVEVMTHEADVHYGLYRDCIQRLQSMYPDASLTSITPNEFSARGLSLAQLCRPFGRLVNCLADTARSDEAPVPEGSSHPSSSRSVVDFILSGMRAVLSKSHTLSTSGANESDLYRALFLDCITHLWRHDSYLRARTGAHSLMPWARRHSHPEELISQELNLQALFPLSEVDLPDSHSEEVQRTQSTLGSPLDIPWFKARHDGYPFCATLTDYVGARRCDTFPSLRDDAALWVSAMTFGLFEAVTRARIRESLLIVPGERQGELVLSGARILRLLAWWRSHASPDVTYGQRVVLMLDQAFSALNMEMEGDSTTSLFRRAGFHRNMSQAVGRAVMRSLFPFVSLAFQLWRDLPQIADLLDLVRDSRDQKRVGLLASSKESMRQAGWCPGMVAPWLAGELKNIPIISAFSKLGPLTSQSLPHGHHYCTESDCYVLNGTHLDISTYQPRHVRPSCDCEFIRLPLDDIVRALLEGVVPTLVYDGTRLHVRPAHSTAYLAISHIWVDGMGSTTEQGLPKCVIARISSLVQTLLANRGAFWMDSLCIPTSRAPRKRGISLMATAFRDAAKVLVIDDTIRACAWESRLWEENLLRIATSRWSRRMWTLQDGLLAHELWFEFEDGPVNVEERLGLWEPPRTNKGNLPPACLYSLVPVLTFRADHRRAASGSASISLSELAQLLRSRIATRPEDETLVFSGLLSPRINIELLVSITGPDVAERRMRCLLLQLRDIPRDFTVHHMPRLTLPCFTWAPRSLSTARGGNMDLGTGICTEHGLLAQYFVARFIKPLNFQGALFEHPGHVQDGPGVLSSLLVFDNARKRTFILQVWEDTKSDSLVEPMPAVNALLFLNSLADSENTGSEELCAAVCSPNPSEMDRLGHERDSPQRAEYLRPCVVHRTTFPTSSAVAENMPVIEYLGGRWVLLT